MIIIILVIKRGNMRFNFISSLILLAGLFTFSNSSEARTFKNAYISFEMLDTWKCKLEQTEFVCRSEDLQESKEAVIILTAKEKGPTDSFPIYADHLSKPIAAPSKTGGTMTSTVTMAPREVLINDQKWIDSLHVNSEVQNYYTRYLATIKDQIAILVTLSAHNSKYQKHSGHFAETVKSLRVIATKDLRGGSEGIRSSDNPSGIWGPQGNNISGGDMIDNQNGDENKSGGGIFSNPAVVGLLILILAAIGYVILRIKKKR